MEEEREKMRQEIRDKVRTLGILAFKHEIKHTFMRQCCEKSEHKVSKAIPIEDQIDSSREFWRCVTSFSRINLISDVWKFGNVVARLSKL
jgi:hypothetical protein